MIMEKKVQQTAPPKPYNVRFGPEQVAWLESVKMGNVSTIIRAAVWLLSLQGDAQDIIRTFERQQIGDISIPADFRKRFPRAAREEKKTLQD